MRYFFPVFLLSTLAVTPRHVMPAATRNDTSLHSLLRFDTSYVSVQVSYHFSRKGPSSSSSGDISATSTIAPVIANGQVKTIDVKYNTPGNRKQIDQLLKLRIVSKKYADAVLSLGGGASYSDAVSTTRETGSGITDPFGISFHLQYSDDETDPTNISLGATVKTTTIVGMPDGISKMTKGTHGMAFAAADTPGDIIGNAGPENSHDPAKITITRIRGGLIIKAERSNKEGQPGEIITTSESFVAVIGSPEQKYEAVIKPIEEGDFHYQQWLPAGPKTDMTDDKKGNNQLKFVITVRNKTNPAIIYPGNFTVRWILKDVTHYPGFCNNYPAYTENPDVDADLVFDPSLQTNTNFENAGSTPDVIDSKPNNGAGAVVQVMCMDYAAWGKLTAVVTLNDNSGPIIASPYYDTKQSYLTIPYDRDDNKLADAWEAQNNLLKSGRPLTWDGDEYPKQQRDQGDGYTLFEEYRGFAMFMPSNTTTALYVHQRTDPNYKDAFIDDRDDLFKNYYEKDNPSDLNWHYLTSDKNQFYYPDELDIEKPLSRWINFNKVEDYFYSEQYCLMIMNSYEVYPGDPEMTACSYTKAEWDAAHLASSEPGGVLNPGDEYVLKDATRPDYCSKSPAKKYLKIEIYPNAIREQFKFIKTQKDIPAFDMAVVKKISRTVKHEIGHCIGIQHHHAPPNSSDAFDNDFQDMAAKDGLTTCVMRYYTDKEKHDANFLQVVIKDYCKKEGMGPFYFRVYPSAAAQKDHPEIYTENVGQGLKPSDNCYSQISVKSKPEDILQ